jgi:hypothetical protein
VCKMNRATERLECPKQSLLLMHCEMQKTNFERENDVATKAKQKCQISPAYDADMNEEKL